MALSGYILSGPVGYLIVNVFRPQGDWTSVASFVEHYSPIQNIPYYFGFLLIGGMLMFASALYLNSVKESISIRFQLSLAFASTIIFCVLISFNYICQTTFIHNLATHFKPEYEPAIAMFTMSNPLSFCWANEMWGYGFLGVSTWLMSTYYSDKSKIIYTLLILNGILSVVSVAWTIIDINWVMSKIGLVLYFAWNVLMILIMVFIYYHSNRKT